MDSKLFETFVFLAVTAAHSVTLAATENMLRLSAGISIHGFATEDFTLNLGNKDCEVLFDILWLV